MAVLHCVASYTVLHCDLTHMACIDTEAGTETEPVHAFGTKMIAEVWYRLMAQGGYLQMTVLSAFIGSTVLVMHAYTCQLHEAGH